MSDCALPPIGFGTYQMDSSTCERAVKTALSVGYTHVDTAEMYENEAAVGRALAAAEAADEVCVATKIHSQHLAYDDLIDHALDSRDRLGVDVIDLLYVHWPIRTYDPTETLSALEELHDRGVVRHIGLSNFTPQLLEDALERLRVPLFAHQVECHPYLPQSRLRELAIEHGHYLVAYSPLAKGAVMDDPILQEIAADHEVSPAQVALAWLQSKEAVVPIPKSETPAHIRDNFAATELTLPSEEIARIDDITRQERVVDFPAAPWND